MRKAIFLRLEVVIVPELAHDFVLTRRIACEALLLNDLEVLHVDEKYTADGNKVAKLRRDERLNRESHAVFVLIS